MRIYGNGDFCTIRCRMVDGDPRRFNFQLNENLGGWRKATRVEVETYIGEKLKVDPTYKLGYVLGGLIEMAYTTNLQPQQKV